MIQAGEEIGQLRDVLLDVAEFQKKQAFLHLAILSFLL